MAQHLPHPEEDAVLYQHQVHVDTLERVVITVRLYQSFRGSFPTRTYQFDDSEIYQSLYVKDWQDATCMVRNVISGVSLQTDPDGEFIRYIVHDADALQKLSEDGGLKFPCPIPENPERLNDVGMLRMQVSVKFMVKEARDAPDPRFINQGDELNAWVKIKVCLRVCVCVFSLTHSPFTHSLTIHTHTHTHTHSLSLSLSPPLHLPCADCAAAVWQEEAVHRHAARANRRVVHAPKAPRQPSHHGRRTRDPACDGRDVACRQVRPLASAAAGMDHDWGDAEGRCKRACHNVHA